MNSSSLLSAMYNTCRMTLEDKCMLVSLHPSPFFPYSLSISLSHPPFFSQSLISFSFHTCSKDFSNVPLTTEAMRQRTEQKKLEHYSMTVIRVHLPNQWVLQGCFKPGESGEQAQSTMHINCTVFVHQCTDRYCL